MDGKHYKKGTRPWGCLALLLGLGLTPVTISACDHADDEEHGTSERQLVVEGVWDLAASTFMLPQHQLEELVESAGEHEQIWAVGDGIAVPLVGYSIDGETNEAPFLDVALPEDPTVGTELELVVGRDSSALDSLGIMRVSEPADGTSYGFHFDNCVNGCSRSTLRRGMHIRCVRNGGYAVSNIRHYKSTCRPGVISLPPHYTCGRAYCWT